MADAGIPKSYEVIVIGAGSMGMSAGYHLVKRGVKTLLIDAFNPPHAHGSHHGEPRLIRHAYHGGDAYVRLALRADDKWRELEALSGEKLLERSGVLNVATEAIGSFEGRVQDARGNGVCVELLDAAEILHRWPGFAVPEDFRGMYEPNAGYLHSERCVAAYRRLALEAGAVLLTNTLVRDVKVAGNAFAFVAAGDEVYHADNIILCAGAWFRTLEPFVRLPIRSVRKAVGWFETRNDGFRAGAFPGFTIGTAEGGYYGFPDIGGAGLKIGRHDGGAEWTPGESFPPFGAYPEDEADLRQALNAYLPGAAGKLLRGAACKYEMTPDEHFVIDAHPAYPNVLLAGGFSGHGFKFASAVGEALADLTVDRSTDLDLSPFSYWRFDETRQRLDFQI
ncbi:N-methyl-L-tryptophan oxidase [Cohnella sp. CFH 77786]|uniref:N-methyl-L-tryptophan oxidase n=1 Tax=Cohnella sp. CFH 77786 TaxID=2662265 RepID=UPI001C60F566|nr:N-methyl-L-tryptophan oxidase [Cohnella sp. CFH 77786]MBW5449273.1 N-methyl-L-tryptophan oxidase [Cohnella sp. CFH 77786]